MTMVFINCSRILPSPDKDQSEGTICPDFPILRQEKASGQQGELGGKGGRLRFGTYISSPVSCRSEAHT